MNVKWSRKRISLHRNFRVISKLFLWYKSPCINISLEEQILRVDFGAVLEKTEAGMLQVTKKPWKLIV